MSNLHVYQIIYNFVIIIIFDSNFTWFVHIEVPHFTSNFNKILNTTILNKYLLIWKVRDIIIMYDFKFAKYLY